MIKFWVMMQNPILDSFSINLFALVLLSDTEPAEQTRQRRISFLPLVLH